MGSFASLETAVRVRDIVSRAVSKQIGSQVQRPIVGRVITVDIINMRAMVWFPGDEQPMPVILLPGRIPATWSRRVAPSGLVNTSTEGYGSQVVCQRYNGQLYVVDTITGGEFAYNLQALNLDNVELLPWDGTGDIVGQPAWSRVSVRVKAGDQSTGIPKDTAVVFGPFMGQLISGVVEMWVSDVENAKRYKFNFMSLMLGDTEPSDSTLNKWFRILPEAEDFNAVTVGGDWDLDVAFRRTLDTTESNGIQHVGLYFRLINRSQSPYVINHKVSIDSNVITGAQGPNGHFTAIFDPRPPFEAGYLGFHGPGGLWTDFTTRLVMDRFGRTLPVGEIGNADTGQAWTPMAGATVDGLGLFVPVTRVGSGSEERVATVDPAPTVGDSQAVEIFATMSLSGTITNGNAEAGVVWRWQNESNYYTAGLLFFPNGAVDWIIRKKVGGTLSTVLTGTTGVTWSQNQLWGFRVSHETDTILFRVWRAGEELANALSGEGLGAHFVVDTSISAPGRVGARFVKTNTSGTQTANFRLHEFRGGAIIRTGVPVEREPAHAQWRNPRLRIAENLQRTAAFTRFPRYTGGRFSWSPPNPFGTGFILLGGIGRHRDGLSRGRSFIQMPPSGAQIPVIPTGNFVTVDANGIPLASGQSLWVAVPPDMDYELIHKYLFIVDNPEYAQQMGIPEWAVFIAGIPFAEVLYPVLGMEYSKSLMILDLVYPVGSVYMSVNNVSPQTFLGGTWEAIGVNRFLVGAGGTFPSQSQGGASSVTLSLANMPAHNHDVPDVIFPSGGTGGTVGVVESWPSGSGSRTVRTGTEGGGQPFSIMPPYFAVFMWKRTA